MDKEHLSDLKIYLTPHANMLNEIVVYAHNPRLIAVSYTHLRISFSSGDMI